MVTLVSQTKDTVERKYRRDHNLRREVDETMLVALVTCTP